MEFGKELEWIKSQSTTLDYSIANMARIGSVDELRRLSYYLTYLIKNITGLRMSLGARIDYLTDDRSSNEVLP